MFDLNLIPFTKRARCFNPINVLKRFAKMSESAKVLKLIWKSIYKFESMGEGLVNS